MGNLPSILTPDFGLLFWMLLSFLVVFGLLAKFGFPIIIKAVEERKNFIDDSLKNARLANEKLAGIKAESEQIIKEAREKQTQIIQEAMATKDHIIADARDKAQQESAQIVADAQKHIVAEKERALKDVRTQVADLSLQIAEKLLIQQLNNDEAQEKYLERILNNME